MAEEKHHGCRTRKTPIASQRDRPRKQEGDLEIEQDEQNRNQVVANVELHSSVLEGFEAALIRRILRGVGPRSGPSSLKPMTWGNTPTTTPTRMKRMTGR
jgi:hypothetical protein